MEGRNEDGRRWMEGRNKDGRRWRELRRVGQWVGEGSGGSGFFSLEG